MTVVTSEFVDLAGDTARSQGVAEGYPFAVVSHPMGMISPEEVRKKAEGVFAEILDKATQRDADGDFWPAQTVYSAERITVEGSIYDVNSFFFDRGWSLGLPVLPPTPYRVAWMLTGTTLKPDMIIGLVPPRMGLLTVELAAVHAVMAGCRPEYMPVLIAVLQAMLEPEANWRGAATTTATTAGLIIINGPIVKEIGIAASQGSAGADHHPNASIGYAISLIADVVGGARSPSPDKSTLGAPADFVPWIFGENEEALPRGWQSLHEQRGFSRGDDVVTFMAVYPPVENIDHWSATAEEHLRWWANLVSPLTAVGGPCEVSQMERDYIIGLGPEHAALIAECGWTQAAFKKEFWERVRRPLSAWPKAGPHMETLVQKMGPVTPETLIPVTIRPDQFLTVIAGGAGKHSHYFAPFPRCSPVSRKVVR